MTSKDYYSSPLIDTIAEFLASISPKLKAGSSENCQCAIAHAIMKLGYGTPFDREQKTINAMLTNHMAGKIACIVVWGFYHDSKIG